MALHILVLAGGSGTRLWPLSREGLPKHLLPLGPGGQSLLRATVERVLPLADAVHVVTAEAQADGCRDALRDCGGEVNVMTEPLARGTGPALGLAVHEVARLDPNGLVASVHADHHVADVDAYRAAVLAAAGWAAATDGLAAVGLTPTAPATGLGYIAVGEPQPPAAFVSGVADRWVDQTLVAAAAALPAARAAGFVEKPPLELATAFLAGGDHLWNLGLFAWTGGAFLRELAAGDAGLDERLAEVVDARAAGRPEHAANLYASLPTLAVEPLVFERSSRLTVVRAEFGWSDLGSWHDLLASRAPERDEPGNVATGDVVLVDAQRCLVDSLGGRCVAVVGARDLVVVDTGDAVLVMPASSSQQVKAVVDELRARQRQDLL